MEKVDWRRNRSSRYCDFPLVEQSCSVKFCQHVSENENGKSQNLDLFLGAGFDRIDTGRTVSPE